MTDTITLTGLVATTPRHIVTSEGLTIVTFRLASAQRRFDRSQERWIDGETNWYTITTFRQLAINSAVSVHKGERVIVTGRLRIREWENGERAGTNIDIEADALGHDLTWGTASFVRSISSSAASATPAETGATDSPESLEGESATPEAAGPESATPIAAREASVDDEFSASEPAPLPF
jgi:single-strand DNA-binding protein